MANAGSLDISGLSELTKMLEVLEPRKQRAALKKAIGKGAAPIVKDARSRVPVETGLTKLAIGKKDKVYRGSNTAVSVVGARVRFKGKKADSIRSTKKGAKRSPALTAHLVEFGTKPHAIRGNLAFNGGVVKYVNHPGSRPKPFLRPAFSSKKAEALKQISDSLWMSFKKAVMK